MHPKIQAIHIGADEAYYVGTECKKCQQSIEKLGSKQKLMLQYILQVAKYVKGRKINKHYLFTLFFKFTFFFLKLFVRKTPFTSFKLERHV